MQEETVSKGSMFIWIVGYGGWAVLNTLHPDPSDYQAIADVTQHPWASMAGSLVPTLVLSPVIYWMSGRLWRHLQNRKS